MFLTILTTLYCLSMAASLMSFEMIVEIFSLIMEMTEKDEMMMMTRGRKNPSEKRKMLYVVSCSSLQEGAQLIPFFSGLYEPQPVKGGKDREMLHIQQKVTMVLDLGM